MYPPNPGLLEMVSSLEISAKKDFIFAHSCSRKAFIKVIYSSLFPNLNWGERKTEGEEKQGQQFGRKFPREMVILQCCFRYSQTQNNISVTEWQFLHVIPSQIMLQIVIIEGQRCEKAVIAPGMYSPSLPPPPNILRGFLASQSLFVEK